MQAPRKNPVIGYLCSYFPYHYAARLNFKCLPLIEVSFNDGYAEDALSRNICGYIRYIQGQINNLDLDGLVLTNCCNGMQRLYDYILEKNPSLFCKMLELPRRDTYSDYSYFYENCYELFKTTLRHFGMDEPSRFPDKIDFFSGEKIGIDQPKILILGSAVSPALFDFFKTILSGYHIEPSLCSTRACGDQLISRYHELSRNNSKSGHFEPCARMDHFIPWFEEYLIMNRKEIRGIIFISSQYCDTYSLTSPIIRSLCRQYGMPFINLEESYRFFGFEQLSTRIEAFKEGIEYNNCRQKTPSFRKRFETVKKERQRHNRFTQMMSLTRAILPAVPLKSIQKVIQNQIDLFTETAWDHPEKIIWTNMVMPGEIFYAANLIPLNMELVAGWLASLGLSREYISVCEGSGFNQTICSYHKATLGLLQEGHFPSPRLSAISSHICDGGSGVARYFKERFDTNAFILDVPYHWTDKTHSYLYSQYERLIQWLEKYLGRPLDYEKLREAMDYSNRARMYWKRANALRKGKVLLPGHLSLRNLYGATFLFGSPLGSEVAESYYSDLIKSEKDSPEPEENEKKRIFWIHFAPLYHNQIMEYFEKELNCWIVMDITGHIYWDEYDLKSPLEGIVRRILSHFYLGDAKGRSKMFRSLFSEYKIDGIILFMHNGCRAIPGSNWRIREIARELKIPFLELSGDCIDPRGFSKEQMKLRMEAFKEVLWGGGIVSRC